MAPLAPSSSRSSASFPSAYDTAVFNSNSFLVAGPAEIVPSASSCRSGRPPEFNSAMVAESSTGAPEPAMILWKLRRKRPARFNLRGPWLADTRPSISVPCARTTRPFCHTGATRRARKTWSAELPEPLNVSSSSTRATVPAGSRILPAGCGAHGRWFDRTRKVAVELEHSAGTHVAPAVLAASGQD